MAWLALVGGVALQAVVTALLGLSLNPADSLLLLAFAAGTATLMGTVLRRRQCAPAANSLRTASFRAMWIRLNLWTAVMFVAFFIGVSLHGAPVMFTLEAAIAPLATLAWISLKSKRSLGQPPIRPSHWTAALALAALGLALAAVLARETVYGLTALLISSALGVVSGISAAAVVIASRELGRAGVNARQVMGRRFIGTFVLAVIAVLILTPAGVIEPPRLHVGIIAVAAVTSIVAPASLLQYGMQRLSPTSVTAALAAIPAITFGIEYAAGRSVSTASIVLSLLIVPASVALLMAQRTPTSAPSKGEENDDRPGRSGIDGYLAVKRADRARPAAIASI